MVREQQLRTSRRTVRYVEAGAGWPVVLIHGFPLSAAMWRPQMDEVPDGWRLIAADLPGFGGGEVDGSEPPTVETYAADVEAVLDALEIDRAVIGGLSMGGYVTFALYRRAPERFSGVILANTRSTADTPEGKGARRALSEVVRTKGPEAVADQMLPKLLGLTTHRSRPGVVREVRRLILANSVSGIDGGIQAMMTRPDSTPDLERVSVPALIVAGEEDTLTPVSDSEALHRAIPRSHLVVLPEAGHLSSLEAPAEFSRALGDFLSSNL